VKKLFSLAVVAALVVAAVKTLSGQNDTEDLWREATRDLDLR
jgi:hypothetical protein